MFCPPAAPRLSEASLTAAGLPTHPYTSMHIDLVRGQPDGKWHTSGTGTHRCTHVTRRFGYPPSALPVQRVSVLGEYDLCSACAHQGGGPARPGSCTSRPGSSAHRKYPMWITVAHCLR